MSAPLIRIVDVTRGYGGSNPLRIADLTVAAADRLVLAGFDAGAAEAFVNLVTGAALPESGQVRIDGRPTSEIATDSEWLSSLDRFGLVTERAVLLEQLSAAANLALPMTLAIDPMTDETRRLVERLAADVALTPRDLDAPAAKLLPAGRAALHLARAIATSPAMVILEHPTARLDQRDESVRFGGLLGSLAARRGFGFIAISEDSAFAKATRARQLRLDPKGRLVGQGLSRWLRPW
ncbi:MAG TPA: ATP-binding cassette domain-containing protein [Vicinamibacterales bacterium]|nr:ATP-binding cassette domain-containing protein [Vicinamibacterales bacterium]